jgi:hypothetical protein
VRLGEHAAHGVADDHGLLDIEVLQDGVGVARQTRGQTRFTRSLAVAARLRKPQSVKRSRGLTCSNRNVLSWSFETREVVAVE